MPTFVLEEKEDIDMAKKEYFIFKRLEYILSLSYVLAQQI